MRLTPHCRKGPSVALTIIYNSPQYCVFEFADTEAGDGRATGGYEIMDKQLRREIFLGGQDAENFRRSVQELIEQGPTTDEIDAFLHGFSGLMTQPVILH